jgi:hypothetical protein
MDTLEKILTFLGNAFFFSILFPLSVIRTALYLLTLLVPAGLLYLLGSLMMVLLPAEMCGASLGAYLAVYTVLGLIGLTLIGVAFVWFVMVCGAIWEAWQWDQE